MLDAMPELPEVETVRRGLAEHITGSTISLPQVLHERTARYTPGGGHAIEQALDGATVTALRRRGKFLWLELDTTRSLLVHLGMSGQMLIKAPRSPHQQRRDPNHRHLRARFTVTPAGPAGSLREVWFVDQRTFGYWHTGQLVPGRGLLGQQGIPDRVSHIAPDPLEPDFDAEAVAAVLKTRHSAIKPLLLNQEIVSGIGNIYADEMLFAARIHPRQLAHRLPVARITSLVGAGGAVMAAAIAQGGTSFDDLYVNVNGASGYFDRSLAAYGRTGKPCLRCGTPLVREVVGGRGTHWCPVCQKRR